MTTSETGSPAVHATCILVGEAGVLLRGEPGSGKSALALAVIDAVRASGDFACLVADDGVILAARNGRLVASCPPKIAGLAELRGRGIIPADHEPAAVVRLVVDLLPCGEVGRMPEEDQLETILKTIRLARQPVPSAGSGSDFDHSVRLVRAALAALG